MSEMLQRDVNRLEPPIFDVRGSNRVCFQKAALEIGVGPVEPHRFVEAAELLEVAAPEGKAPAFEDVLRRESSEN